MGSFRRSLFGFRRGDVEAAIAARDERISGLERELAYLSGMVLERERTVEALRAELKAANERAEGSLRAVEAMSARIDELHAQARSQATRIRMKALAEAVEVTGRVRELAERMGVEAEQLRGEGAGELAGPIEAAAPAGGYRNDGGHRNGAPTEIFEGRVEVEIGPLDDFSQLVGFEDAAGQIGATSEISVKRFSDGRATLAMQLDEPVALLRELEERSPLEFSVRRVGDAEVILDIDDADEAQAA